MKICENPLCGNEIPANRLRHNAQQRYCCLACASEDMTQQRKKDGFFEKFSKLGNDAQRTVKEKTGRIPGYDTRGAVRAAREKRSLGGGHKKGWRSKDAQ